MYLTSIIQQHPQQILTESLACQKRKVVADSSAQCGAYSFFPLFSCSIQQAQQNQRRNQFQTSRL